MPSNSPAEGAKFQFSQTPKRMKSPKDQKIYLEIINDLELINLSDS